MITEHLLNWRVKKDLFKKTLKATRKLRMRTLTLPAYNLQDVLTALVIIGVLMLLALPKLMPLISKAKSTEAQLQLKHIHNLQTTYRYMYSKYSMDLSEIDYEGDKTVLDNGRAKYRYEVLNATGNSFKARATAVVDFDGDGIFNVWEIDEQGAPKQITKD